MMLIHGVGTWCWYMMLIHGVGTWCWHMMLVIGLAVLVHDVGMMLAHACRMVIVYAKFPSSSRGQILDVDMYQTSRCGTQHNGWGVGGSPFAVAWCLLPWVRCFYSCREEKQLLKVSFNAIFQKIVCWYAYGDMRMMICVWYTYDDMRMIYVWW